MSKFLKTLFSVSVFAFASQTQAQDCDESCLIEIADQYMDEVVKQDWSALPWGEQVRFTENNVAMMIGDGFWGAVSTARDGAYRLADPQTGNVLWFGVTEEHGQAAYYGMRLQVEKGSITEVETYLGREGTPDLFAPLTAGYQLDSAFSQELSRSQRSSRRKMIRLVEDYFDTKEQNDGHIHTRFAVDCEHILNGVNLTQGEHWRAQAAEGCQQQMAISLYKPVERIRARRYPMVDRNLGVVVALSLQDHATRFVDYKTNDGRTLKVDVAYPNTRGMLELFKIVDGEIIRIEGISVFLPYYIHSLWD